MIEKNYDEKVNEALENANFHRATAIDLLVKMAQLPYREAEEMIEEAMEELANNDYDDWMGGED